MFDKIKHELNYIKKEDITAVFVFLVSIVPALLGRLVLRLCGQKVWLISEDRNEARDNGICFFRWLMKAQSGSAKDDKGQKRGYIDRKTKVFYAISYDSPDYKKVAKLGPTVRYGSLMHWVIYFNCEFNISTQKACRPGTAVGYVLERFGINKGKNVFLQHGITLSRATWLFYENTGMRVFICGAKPEYDYVCEEFGYPKGYVSYAGFCRFDDYHRPHEVKRQILLIPSWREWIGSKNEFSDVYEDTSVFTNTEYYKKYQSLINSERLHRLLEENDVELYFYPHRNMQSFIGDFSTECDRIKIVDSKSGDIRKLLMESALMVTDYSSVALDFAYMKKPVVFYQFDVKRFREAQYEAGYFDYETSGLGKWCESEEDVLAAVEKSVKGAFAVDAEFERAHADFFPRYDDKNCERVFKKMMSVRHDNDGVFTIKL